MTRPGLATLEAFLAVARHGSFRRAAAERGVSPSALSHVVRGLEERLGVRLFNRTNRSVRITEAGQRLLERLGPALGDVDAALKEAGAHGERPHGALRLNVPRVALEMVILPLLGRFHRTYPDIRLEIVSDDGLVDSVAAGFDAGIRPGRRLPKEMIAVPVGPARRFAIVGAPSYFATREKPLTPADLHAHACIGRRYPSGRHYAWEFGSGADAVEIESGGPLLADDGSLMIAAALEGMGLAQLHDVLVKQHLADGRLVRVLEDWCPVLPPFFLYYPGRRQVPPPLRAFIDMARRPG